MMTNRSCDPAVIAVIRNALDICSGMWEGEWSPGASRPRLSRPGLDVRDCSSRLPETLSSACNVSFNLLTLTLQPELHELYDRPGAKLIAFLLPPSFFLPHSSFLISLQSQSPALSVPGVIHMVWYILKSSLVWLLYRDEIRAQRSSLVNSECWMLNGEWRMAIRCMVRNPVWTQRKLRN